MSNIEINSSVLGNNLQALLTAQDINPGDNAGYELCKQIWIAHPLGGKLVEKPVRLALSKPRQITVDCEPKEMLVDAFMKEWDALDATSHIRDVMFLKRTYGAAAIIVGAEGVATTEPLDPWKLSDQALYFNQFDPLNLAGSIIGNQNPNAPDFQKPNHMITAAGQPYHPSRSVVVFNGTPIYLSYQSSAFGFTGRSVFQRALYPLRSFIQSMVTDDLVTFKAGLLIAKQKPAGSIVNRLMQTAAGIKRTFLQEGVTGNVLSIDVDEEIEAINMQNTDTAMTVARDNIIANIAAASDVPALLLKDEAFTQGFGEGTEDAKAIVQYVNGIREEMNSLFAFFDKIVMHRAWNKEFYDAVCGDPEYGPHYSKMTYEKAFYEWQHAFKAEWENLIEEPQSEKVKADDIKLKGLTEVLRTFLPVMDPVNRANVIQWACDNLNEMPDMFDSVLTIDAEALAEYEPPEPMAQPKEPSARADAMGPVSWGYKARGDAEFKEADHPRDKDGKFGSGGGGSAASTPAGATQGGATPAAGHTEYWWEQPKDAPRKGPTEAKGYMKESYKPEYVAALAPEKRKELRDMYLAATANKNTFDAVNTEIAESVGARAAVVNVKGTKRAAEKVITEYNGDPSKVKDLLRSTLAIKSLRDVSTVVEKLSAQYGEFIKFRNLLDPAVDSFKGTGYRDVTAVVMINGTAAEIQINMAPMLKAKEVFHKHYEIIRTLEGEANTVRPLFPDEIELIDRLNAEMKAGYDAAWSEMQASNS